MWELALLHVVHFIRTAFGDSAQSYASSPAKRIHGPGQGSRGGPSGCTIMCSPLLEAQEKLAHGITFYNPAQQQRYHLASAMFVDDQTSYTNNFLRWLHCDTDFTEVISYLRHDAQIWERLLWTSGGLLKLVKCLYYVMYWQFDSEGNATLAPSTELLPPIQLSSGNTGLSNTIAQYDCQIAHRTLGAWLCPSLSMTAAYQRLQAIVSLYSRRIVTGSLTRWEIWMAYFSVFSLQMKYTLPISHHSSTSLRKLQSPAVRATLTQLGFSRNTPLAVVYGPVDFGGLGFRDLAVEQGIEQLCMILRHLRMHTEQGKLLTITLQWWQLTAGVTSPLWDNPSLPLHYLKKNWLTSVQGFLSSSQSSLHLRGLMTDFPKATRIHDQCIMDVISQLPVSPPKLRAFNRCRLYMRVTYLSEISTADGLQISRTSWTGQRNRNSPLLWPYQPAPGPKSFRVWRRLIATAFLDGRRRRVCPRTIDLFLQHPLRGWLPDSSGLRSSWTDFFSPSTRQLYRVSNQTTKVHSRTLGPRSHGTPTCIAFHVDPHEHEDSQPLPIDAVPVDLDIQPRYLTISRTVPAILSTTPVAAPRTWEEYLSRLDPWETDLLHNTRILHLQPLLKLLGSKHKIFLASDGGAQDPLGSFGGLVASRSTILAETGGQASGANPRSFRAEGYGILTILRLVHHLLCYYNIPRIRGPVTIVCDSESLLTRLESALASTICRPRRALFSEADVESGITDTIRSLQMNLQLEHVHSHQDTRFPNAPLSWEATLNTRCDELATQYLASSLLPLPLVPFIPASIVHLQVNGTSITHHVPSQLRYLCNRQSTKDYLIHRYGWDDATLDSVDWTLFRPTFLSLSFNLRLFVIKWRHHLLPLGSRQHRINPHHNPHCPSCDHPLEDDNHFLRCPRLSRLALLQDVMQRLPTLYNKWHVDPSLRSLIRHAFLLLLDSTHSTDPPDMLPDKYLPLYHSQQRIGWDHLFLGHFATDWISLQHQYLAFAKKPNNTHQASSFFKELTSELWATVHSLWLQRNEHLHGPPMTALHSIKRLQLLSEISALYDSAPSMLSSDRSIFDYPLADRTRHSTTSLRNFILFAKPIIRRSIKDAVILGSNTKTIDSYFGPRFPPPPELWDVIHPLVDHYEYDLDPD